jgi:hypothetical protein
LAGPGHSDIRIPSLSTPAPQKACYEALRCPKDYVLFTAEEGADGHCEGGAQVLFHRVAYDWLDKTLATSQAS